MVRDEAEVAEEVWVGDINCTIGGRLKIYFSNDLERLLM